MKSFCDPGEKSLREKPFRLFNNPTPVTYCFVVVVLLCFCFFVLIVTLFQFKEQLQSAQELETNQAQLRGQIQEAQKHVSNT